MHRMRTRTRQGARRWTLREGFRPRRAGYIGGNEKSMSSPVIPPGTQADTSAETGFALDHENADCAAIIVTYNSAADIGRLLDSLPPAAAGLRVRVVVVDNGSADNIASVVARYPGVRFVASGGNLGYAGGLNVGRRHVGLARSVLALNPDLVLAPGSIRA